MKDYCLGIVDNINILQKCWDEKKKSYQGAIYTQRYFVTSLDVIACFQKLSKKFFGLPQVGGEIFSPFEKTDSQKAYTYIYQINLAYLGMLQLVAN